MSVYNPIDVVVVSVNAEAFAVNILLELAMNIAFDQSYHTLIDQ